ncbi:TPA: polysaccharide pyruvyl transferase family protein [Citrobacter amalonaticus]|uniref:polysaccharide pyruvyl transferase family protein n=1 Tax=Citrobacter amalonaticus TaxID=35703 RepID=UPI0028C22179|nr:polysaccharide pyruvyl transferase family protein [Citrobacter amalonaticus]HBU6575560.1 polysaccharide pyruvyl transferase family protein [Citrobacter amalonaticus]
MKINNLILRLGLNKFAGDFTNYDNVICLYNTSVSSLNVGDEIINASGLEQLTDIFKYEQFYHISTHVGSKSIGIHHANLCKERIVCGSNLLCDTMFRSANWELNPFDIIKMKPVTLMGVGWNKYGANTSTTTAYFYRRLLSDSTIIHSVRDDFTKDKLNKIGIKNVLNTGCPTMWKLTEEHCESIKKEKSDRVVFTLTDYDKDFKNDKLLVEILCKTYDKVFFWPQGSGDLEYFNEMNISNVETIPPRLADYDNLLNSGNIDFVGTRLHGGIRALQFGNRALIVAFDNRAIEKAKDFNLPIVHRDRINEDLLDILSADKSINIKINNKEIEQWKQQFQK